MDHLIILPITQRGILTHQQIRKIFKKVIDIIFLEINKIKSNGVTEDQLNFVRSKAIKSLKFSLQTSASLVDSNVTDIMLNQDQPYSLDNFVADIEKLTVDDVQKMCSKYI